MLTHRDYKLIASAFSFTRRFQRAIGRENIQLHNRVVNKNVIDVNADRPLARGTRRLVKL